LCSFDDDDDDDDDDDGSTRDYEDTCLSKEIIHEIECYQEDPVMESLSVFFCCALSPADEARNCQPLATAVKTGAV